MSFVRTILRRSPVLLLVATNPTTTTGSSYGREEGVRSSLGTTPPTKTLEMCIVPYIYTYRRTVSASVGYVEIQCPEDENSTLLHTFVLYIFYIFNQVPSQMVSTYRAR